jgi:hypothetical protein
MKIAGHSGCRHGDGTQNGQKSRADSELAYHVLDIHARSISSQTGRHYELSTFVIDRHRCR